MEILRKPVCFFHVVGPRFGVHRVRFAKRQAIVKPSKLPLLPPTKHAVFDSVGVLFV